MAKSEESIPLTSANRIGLIGDLHGDVGALLTIARSMHENDVHILLALGDVGLLWPGKTGRISSPKSLTGCPGHSKRCTGSMAIMKTIDACRASLLNQTARVACVQRSSTCHAATELG